MDQDGNTGTTGHDHEAVTVTIGGRSYRLRGDDPNLLRRLAEEVDGTIREIAGDRAGTEDPRVVVLAALNVAAEREDLRRATIDRAARLRERLAALDRRLATLEETVVEGPSPPREDRDA